MILIGTSGFSYDDWKGHFYPEKTGKSEMLPFYSRRFSAVEINSTYYAIPSPSMFSKMSEKTPENFQFVVKAPKEITHSSSASGQAFPLFREAIRPIVEAGKFGCILAQYPWSFENTTPNRVRLRGLKDEFGDLPVVVEFRNSGWAHPAVFDYLRNLGLGFCCVDEPHLKGLMPGTAVATSSIGYIRFHGRNAAKWWKHDAAWERYDYLYTEVELEEWKVKVREISDVTEKTYVFFNNHYHGKAAENARMFSSMLEKL